MKKVWPPVWHRKSNFGPSVVCGDFSRMQTRVCSVTKLDLMHRGSRLSVQAKETLVSCPHFVHPTVSHSTCCLSVWPCYRKPLIWVRPAAMSLSHSRKEICIPAELLHSIQHALRCSEGHAGFKDLFTSQTRTWEEFCEAEVRQRWSTDLERIWYLRWCPCGGGRTPGPPGCLRSQWGSSRHSGQLPRLCHQGRSSSSGRLWRIKGLLNSGTTALPVRKYAHLRARWLTFSEFAYSQHAVAGREVPYAQGFVIANGGTEREMGMSSQAPHFSFHMTLQKHTRT